MNRKSNNKWAMLLIVLTILTGTACTTQKKSGEQTDEPATEQTEVTQDELEALAAALPQYKLVNSFHEGLAAVCNKEDLWGFIDKTGKEVIPCQYQYFPAEFNDGVAIACTNENRMFIIDHEGNEALRYKTAGEYAPSITEHFKSPLATDSTPSW